MRAARDDPEREDEQHVGRERERVPVADRVAQPRRPAAVLEERRDRLARERPEDRRAERDDEQPADDAARPRPVQRGEDEAEQREAGVRERPVELVPRAVGRDRPGDREPAPRREGEQRAEHVLAAARDGNDAEQGEREHAAGDRDRPGRHPERVAGEENAEERARPRAPATPVRGTAARSGSRRIRAKLA